MFFLGPAVFGGMGGMCHLGDKSSFGLRLVYQGILNTWYFSEDDIEDEEEEFADVEVEEEEEAGEDVDDDVDGEKGDEEEEQIDEDIEEQEPSEERYDCVHIVVSCIFTQKAYFCYLITFTLYDLNRLDLVTTGIA